MLGSAGYPVARSYARRRAFSLFPRRPRTVTDRSQAPAATEAPRTAVAAFSASTKATNASTAATTGHSERR